MHVDDAKRILLLIVHRRQEQPGVGTVGDQEQTGHGQPGHDLGRNPVEVWRRGQLVYEFPHGRGFYSLLIRNAAAVANGAIERINTA